MKQDMVVSVSSVIARIKNVLTQTMNLDGIWIQGEISNLTKHRSGHYYFSIKDRYSEISCVMFSSYVCRLSFQVEEGMNVLVSGNVNVYEQRGSLQLIIRQMKQDGMGDLYLEFEQRKKALLEAGYFDELHKKKKPSYIGNIGVVTASQAAALHDVVSTIQKRWPMMKITLYPSYVQGNLAPKSLIQSIKMADKNGHDALLIVRGGGSFEDLFCFNDVNLVKTIYDLQTYTVSGVGHEIDTTLCDLVCDHRSVTPTAAAQWVSLDQYEVFKEICQKEENIISSMYQILDVYQSRFEQYATHPYLKDPNAWILEKKLRVDAYHIALERVKDQYISKMDTLNAYNDNLLMGVKRQLKNNSKMIENNESLLALGIQNQMKNIEHNFKKKCSLLDAYSPLKIISRGYSISRIENHVIKSIQEIDLEDEMTTRFTDGVVVSKILSKKGV